jgi:nucleoside-diphosphate-sugar epimerase
MRVVVTGGQGLIGTHVVRELVAAHHDVTVFDRVPGPERGPVRYVAGEIQDLGQVYGALAGAEAVIHLAGVRRFGVTTEDVTFRTNVVGSFNVHEAASRLGIRRVVSTSSESILGWDYAERPFLPSCLPLDEDHPVNPLDSYALSKQVGESIARSYAAKGGMTTIVLRPPWVISEEQMADLNRRGGRVPVKFSLFSYIDARDLASAYLRAIKCPIEEHMVLFTLADDTTVAEPLATLLPRLYPELGDMARELVGTKTAVKNDRAKHILGWRPTRSWRRPDSGDA